MAKPTTDAGPKRVDPRVLRTRVLLQAAALELAAERELDTITIAHVAERATINRATVYQHYRDRDDLLLDAMDGELSRLGGLIARCPLVVLPATMPAELVEVFRHIESARVLYRRMLGPCGSARFIDHLHRLVAEQVVHQLSVDGKAMRDEEAVRLRAHCAAGSFIGLVRHWLLAETVLPAEHAAANAWTALVSAR
ncbi:TetR-like C-terminal domain-containing protein [Actinosynnema sp. NPDC047251]|uniref:Transcriptional regulator, TetR family n=1 Tax=Saccharothrix espanaensis (strain ATCC 51144 / DSM 44229 / JCM 9112 / NBRC 15066 / NRRL 15764) TaxID=1179773 RepID=K0JYV6_SACES|nr:TetR-like C-terminal domain-containing protein [Saccharothrix espanaensis]CCH29438.1 Transcriptional regulator, TetR family [Saccharothrix espanaensis DSM 44229]